MATHKMGPEMYALVPYVSVLLKGDCTGTINPQDEIETPLIHYRVDSLAYDETIDKTIALVREIVP